MKRSRQRNRRRKMFRGPYAGPGTHEEIAAYTLAFWAGLANRLTGGNFSVRLARSKQEDHVEKTDIFLSNGGSVVLRIDVTRNPAKLRHKYARARWLERNGGEWVKPMLITNREVIDLPFVCLGQALSAAFSTGEFVTVERACPTHGNSCELAVKLRRLGEKLNRSLGGKRTIAFQMPTVPPLP